MKVLIVGGAGYVGGGIVDLLSKENEASFRDVLRFVCKIYNISDAEFLDEPEEKVESDFSTMVKIFNKKKQGSFQKIVYNTYSKLNIQNFSFKYFHSS